MLPLARIPNLAIHLTAGAERDHFAPNLQEHAKAILTLDPVVLSTAQATKGGQESAAARLHPLLMQILSSASSTDASTPLATDEVVDLELQLIDVQPSTLGGESSTSSSSLRCSPV
jgi:aspartyl aminopeptidase